MPITNLAVCLTTCERPELTHRTVHSFIEQNGTDRFMLLHADDASTSMANQDLAAHYGFETVAVHASRRGAQECRRSAVHAARDKGASHVLLLENDWEAVAPFPWQIAETLMDMPEIYTFRLFGHYRVRGNPSDRLSNRPCVEKHAGRDNMRAVWSDVPGIAGIEMGSIHMGTAPCVTSIDDLCWLLASADCAADMMITSGQIDRLTARPKHSSNWFWDIGFNGTGAGHGTPGFIA